MLRRKRNNRGSIGCRKVLSLVLTAISLAFLGMRRIITLSQQNKELENLIQSMISPVKDPLPTVALEDESPLPRVSRSAYQDVEDFMNPHGEDTPKDSLPTVALEDGSPLPRVLRSTYQDVEDFMNAHGDTPAARFVNLIREYLHGEPHWERERIDACYKGRNLAKCLAGLRNYNAASEEEIKSEQLKIPFYENNKEEGSVYDTYRYRNTTHILAMLGSHPACLPLVLAGASVPQSGVIVELGPFAGYSTKCVALGLKTTGAGRKNALKVYDTYSGEKNFRAITSYAPWVQRFYPKFTRQNPDFLQLVKDTVQYVYPEVELYKGWINSDALNDDTLGGNQLSVLMIDSAKSARDLHMQIGGLTIPVGTILVLMDFSQVRQQILQMFGCLRGNLIPVYASWGMEQWAWIVTKSFNINQPWVKECYDEVQNNTPEAMKVMTQQASEDILFLAGLSNNNETIHGHYDYWINRENNTIQGVLSDETNLWQTFYPQDSA